MKKYYILGLFAALMSVLVSCSEENETLAPTVQYIELSELKKTMSVGEVSQLVAKVLPDAVVDKTVEWNSSDLSVATVDENGNITALTEGEAKISAKVSNVTALCALTVVPVAVESVTLNETVKKMDLNTTLQLVATVLPENATYKDVTWTSSDETIATVDNNGLVTTRNTGNVVITATSGDKVATCSIVIVGEDPLLTETRLDMQKGETKEIELVLPVRLDAQTVTWNSDNDDIAKLTVNPDNSCKATVTATGIGNTEIHAVVGTETVTCSVAVIAPKEEVTGTTVVMNLSLYNDYKEIDDKVSELDAKGIKTYRLFGDFGKLVKYGNDGQTVIETQFAKTSVEEIDFTGIDPETWPEVQESNINIEGVAQKVIAKGLPDKMFNRGTEGKPLEVFNNLKTVILPKEVKMLGYYSFQRTNAVTVVAPGVKYLGNRVFTYATSLTLLELTSEESILYDVDACKGFKKSGECTLKLHTNNGDLVSNKTVFGVEWKEIILID